MSIVEETEVENADGSTTAKIVVQMEGEFDGDEETPVTFLINTLNGNGNVVVSGYLSQTLGSGEPFDTTMTVWDVARDQMDDWAVVPVRKEEGIGTSL